MSIEAATSARLENYHILSDAAIARVSEVAGRQSLEATPESFMSSVGYRTSAHPDVFDGYATQVVDWRPSEHDPDKALAFHLPMANRFAPHTLYGLATIVGTLEDTRVVAAAHPSTLRNRSGVLPFRECISVYQGDMSRSLLNFGHYLRGVETVDQAGGSLGAELALETGNATSEDITGLNSAWDNKMERFIALDPVAVKKRSLLGLGLGFAQCASALEHYLQAPAVVGYDEAVEKGLRGRRNEVGYVVSLARATNLAVAKAMARSGTESRIHAALISHPEAQVNMVWGSESELALDGVMRGLSERIVQRYGNRYVGQRLLGQRHAFVNDIHLVAGLIYDALKSPAPSAA